MKNITNQVFGSLTAIYPHHSGKNHTIYWKYQCACGNAHIARANVISYQAKKGILNIPSCGCVELANKTKHGFRKLKDTHPAYRTYRGIINRCYNNNDPGYKWYGAVGVTLCNEWKNNPKAFIKWSINNGWKPGLQIDKDILCKKLKISPHIYSPETCQWTTAKINVGFATNRSNFGKHPNIHLSIQDVEKIEELYFSGVETNKSELARMFGVTPSSTQRLIKIAIKQGRG